MFRLEEGKPVEMKDLTTLLLTLSSLNHTPSDKQAFMKVTNFFLSVRFWGCVADPDPTLALQKKKPKVGEK